MTQEQLQQLTDEQFEEQRIALMTELQRRNRLNEIPEEVKAKTLEYIEVGGDSTTLTTALQTTITNADNILAEREAKRERIADLEAQEGESVDSRRVN